MAAGSILVINGRSETSAEDLLARLVKTAGYAPLSASTGPEGLAFLSNLKPEAVLLDIDQVGGDPFELIQQIRLENADVPMIVLSATNDTALAVRVMRAGASDFLVKPVGIPAIRQAVKTALQPSSEGASGSPATGRSTSEGDGPLPDLDLLFGNSDRMKAVESIVRRAADTNATILLQGESGSGKEMVAKAIHQISDRRGRPFLKVNCASLPADLLESELFGHEKGAFTGAHRRKPGKFELAHRGTFLLDEIGEMPLSLQAKLLHVLQDGKFFRVGGSELISTDTRLIAATNKNLAALVGSGLFREDLYYRLNVVTISIPPLRERREEIPALIAHFVDRFCKQYNRDAPKLSPATMRVLQEYAWPGNVRELENMIKRAVVLQTEGLVQDEIALRTERPGAPKAESQVPPVLAPHPHQGDLGLKEIAKRAAMAAERTVIKEVLERVRWNRAAAARILKISYKAMLYKIRQVGLDTRRESRPGRK